MTKHKSESLADFFNTIGGEKKKLKEEKDKIIGDLSLDNLFSSMEEESRKIKKQKKQLKKDVEAFKKILFKEDKKEKPPSVDEYIEPPRPEEEIADAIRQSEKNEEEPIEEETVVEHAVKILDKINEEVETVETEPDIAKLRKEIIKENTTESEIAKLRKELDVLKQIVNTQGGGGEVRLEFLDDVDRDSAKVNGKILQYQASSGKFIGASASGFGPEESINTTGIITAAQFVGPLTGNVIGDVTGNADTATTLESNSSVNTSGIITASSFVGDITGNLTGEVNASKFDTNSSGVLVTGIATATAFVGPLTGNVDGTTGTFSGDVSAANATFTGDVSIGGTLTYEDVTSIDSVGLITARSGLDLGTSNIVRLEGATATKTSTASAMVDSFSSSTYQSASYQVQVRRGNDYHTTSINLVHANSSVYLSEYGTVITNESLATFDADIDSGNVRLKAAPTSSESTVFKIFRTVMNS